MLQAPTRRVVSQRILGAIPFFLPSGSTVAMHNLRNTCLFTLIAALCATSGRAEPVKEVTISPSSPESAPETVHVDVDMTKRRPISDKLYGIFFEEVRV